MFDALLQFDRPIFTVLNSWATVAPEVWKAGAIYGVYLVPLALLFVWFIRKERDVALTAALAGILAWQGLNNLVQLLTGPRVRPVSLVDLHFPATEFLFDRPGPSFPSDHTAFLVAITVIFWFKGKRNVAWLIGTITVLTLLARVVTAQHWPSDIIVGAMIGSFAGWLFIRFDGWIQGHVVGPLVRFAKKIWL
jgi:undecaprenyl-diphosphatase